MHAGHLVTPPPSPPTRFMNVTNYLTIFLILIAIRNPVRQTSLFKFMTVLRLEVWLSIVAALIATAIMIWLLDKYSPYSARNNKDAYTYPCR